MKLPSRLLVAESTGVRVVRRMRVDVAKRVIWMWSVVCGLRGRGRARLIGLSVGVDFDTSDAGGVLDVASIVGG